ncbi:MAG: hypothetical protein ACI9EX_001836 [Oleispira sp.]|jgi:hypothetical protein
MNDISCQRLKRTLSSALLNIDDMQRELAIVRAQCKLLQEEMRAIRVRSNRSRIHTISSQNKNSA